MHQNESANMRTKYRAEHPATAAQLASEECSSNAIAQALGVSQTTLKAWEKRHPPFAAAMDRVRRRELRERSLSKIIGKIEKRRRWHEERERERMVRLSNKPTNASTADGS